MQSLTVIFTDYIREKTCSVEAGSLSKYSGKKDKEVIIFYFHKTEKEDMLF
jgi:hypothetical protein